MVLLDRLREAAGQFVSLADLGADRRQVWDDLEALEAFGFQIEHHPYLGAAYRGPARRGSVPTRSSTGWGRGGSAGGSPSGTGWAAPTTWPRGPLRRSPTTGW